MISKPVKWRRVGVAALAGVSLALTALAAQVSPPNVRTVEAAAQGGEKGGEPAAAKRPDERVAVKLPNATLDRYAGSYKLTNDTFIDVKREGEKLMARVTGQPWYEIFPEDETHFFWKITNAQITFANDGSGGATLHQHGKDMPMTSANAGESEQVQAALDARIASQAAAPGTEAALRHYLEAAAAGKIDYGQMESILADVTRRQEAAILAMTEQLGPVQSIKFTGVGQMGWDVYEVKYAKGALQYRVKLGGNGKMESLMAMVMP